MLITRAVTVRGVPFLRLPDTMALHPYVIRREPVCQQRLAQRVLGNGSRTRSGNELPGIRSGFSSTYAIFPFSSMPIRTVS